MTHNKGVTSTAPDPRGPRIRQIGSPTGNPGCHSVIPPQRLGGAASQDVTLTGLLAPRKRRVPLMKPPRGLAVALRLALGRPCARSREDTGISPGGNSTTGQDVRTPNAALRIRWVVFSTTARPPYTASSARARSRILVGLNGLVMYPSAPASSPVWRSAS